MIIINNEQALRVKCENVLPEEIGELVEKLDSELKYSALMGRPGIGLAAPQIGIAKNIAIVRINDHLKVNLINCYIKNQYDKTIFRGEGCLSFPGRIENTMRYQEIHIVNNIVSPNFFIATGLLAIVCQHELDHLNNILLPDIAIKEVKKKIGPNDKCICNSNIKYKKCCGRIK